MLIDYSYKSKHIIASYINDKGDIELKRFPFENPFNYEKCSRTDRDCEEELTTWDRYYGIKKVSTNRPNKHSIYYQMYELTQEEKELLFRVKRPKTYFIDIETEIIDGFPDPIKADSRVLSIAIVYNGGCFVYGLTPLSDKQKESLEKDTNEYFKDLNEKFTVNYVHFEDGKDSKGNERTAEWLMLDAFFNKFVPKMAVITGWNFVDYDWMFLMKRAANIGLDTKKASPTGSFAPHQGEFIMPKHRLVVDYLEIYKKFQQKVKVKESMALDFVANKMLGVKKLEYKGTLKDLYEQDFYKFILYNVIDTALVYLIDKIYKFINIMLAISNYTQTKLSATLSVVEMVECAIRERMLKERNIVLVDFPVQDFSAPGGWVKEPIRGMHENVAVFDFASLYPKTMMQFNVCSSSYLGMIDENREYIVYKSRKILYDPTKHILTDHGSVFDMEDSINKMIMDSTYKKRKIEKGEMKRAKMELKSKVELRKRVRELLANK